MAPSSYRPMAWLSTTISGGASATRARASLISASISARKASSSRSSGPADRLGAGCARRGAGGCGVGATDTVLAIGCPEAAHVR